MDASQITQEEMNQKILSFLALPPHELKKKVVHATSSNSKKGSSWFGDTVNLRFIFKEKEWPTTNISLKEEYMDRLKIFAVLECGATDTILKDIDQKKLDSERNVLEKHRANASTKKTKEIVQQVKENANQENLATFDALQSTEEESQLVGSKRKAYPSGSTQFDFKQAKVSTNDRDFEREIAELKAQLDAEKAKSAAEKAKNNEQANQLAVYSKKISSYESELKNIGKRLMDSYRNVTQLVATPLIRYEEHVPMLPKELNKQVFCERHGISLQILDSIVSAASIQHETYAKWKRYVLSKILDILYPVFNGDSLFYWNKAQADKHHATVGHWNDADRNKLVETVQELFQTLPPERITDCMKERTATARKNAKDAKIKQEKEESVKKEDVSSVQPRHFESTSQVFREWSE